MALYYNTNGFAHHRLDDVVEILADLGYDGIALTPDVQHLDPMRCSESEIDGLRRHCDRRGLAITIETGARFVLDARRKHYPNLVSSTDYDARRNLYRRIFDIAARLGAPNVSLWSGAPDLVEPESVIDARLTSRLGSLLDDARARGVALSLEPEPGMHIDRIAGYWRIHDALRRDDLGLTIDVGHLAVNEDPRYEEHLAQNLPALRVVHFDDSKAGRHEHLAIGEGDLDWRRIRAILSEPEFQGPLVVELSRHSHDAVRAATAAIRTLRELGF